MSYTGHPDDPHDVALSNEAMVPKPKHFSWNEYED